LVLKASFNLNVANVDPTGALADAAGALSDMLGDVSGGFEAVVGGFSSALDDAEEFLRKIADSDNVNLYLNATIDVSAAANLSFTSFSAKAEVRALSSSLLVDIDNVEVSAEIGSVTLTARPSLTLFLSAENNAVPFFLPGESSKLSSFEFDGSLETRLVTTVSVVPAVITIETSVPDFKNASLKFGVFVDIDLRPIKDSEYFLISIAWASFHSVVCISLISNKMLFLCLCDLTIQQ
jgi:hypothetical protein